MTSAARRAREKFEDRERRPTDLLSLKDVPERPVGAEVFHKNGFTVYDADHDGYPCRWRYDSRGLTVFIRYYPDHATANAFPWKQVYDREGEKRRASLLADIG